jgi:hypothetical protein
VKDQSTIKLPFEVSPIATWSDKNLHLRNSEMRDRESALCIRLWSQPLVTRREGVSLDKLHFGVLEIATWKVEMPHLQIYETRIHKKRFLHRHLFMTIVILGKELVQKSSVSKLWRSRNEVSKHSAQNCRMSKYQNECKIPWIQSNGAVEFEQDRRATVARHSETARNH